METIYFNPAAKFVATANAEPATPARDRHVNFRVLLQRRSLWLIGVLSVASAGAFGYHWAFASEKARRRP
jgi:hypothetical protein